VKMNTASRHIDNENEDDNGKFQTWTVTAIWYIYYIKRSIKIYTLHQTLYCYCAQSKDNEMDWKCSTH
jgi:hypothetical protein